MPHNRTRIWVGVAIIAVTIPAVGQYYYSSATHNLRGDPIAGRADLTSRRQDSFGSGRLSKILTERDYQREVDAALSRNGAKIPEEAARGGTIPLFSDPGLELLPYVDEGPATVASLDSPSVADNGPVDAPGDLAYQGPDDALVDDSEADEPILSDRAVYELVVDQLDPDDRDTFVSSWALMTPEERAAMIDEFRAGLQSGR